MSQVSIVIPVYNAETSLRACLDSIAKQTFVDFEALLINDGSTDSSVDICREYCEKDSRFKLITQENAGPAAARNTGIENATGKYITFIDSDDYVEENMLAVLIDLANNADADITVFGYCTERSDKTVDFICKHTPGIYRGNECKALALDAIDIHTRNNLPPYSWVRFLKTAFLKALPVRFDPAIHRSEDYLYWLQVHFRAECVCIATDKMLYHYVDNSVSITHSYVKGYWEMAKTIYTHLCAVLPNEAAVKKRLNIMLVHRSLIALNNASRCKDSQQFKAEVHAIINDPLFRKVLNSISFKQGFHDFKFYYLLAKLRCTPIIIKRYQLKQA